MNNTTFLLASTIIFLYSCGGNTKTNSEDSVKSKRKISISKEFDVQGHRGARGLYPENSIIGFIEALKLGVTTLEMDLVVSQDRHLIVSHEPYISSEICKWPTHDLVMLKEEDLLNIYQMSLSEIQDFDCGSRGNKKFPKQKRIKTYKPTLEEVITAVEEEIKKNNLPLVKYNIETKTRDEWDNWLTPAPAEFIKLLIETLDKFDIWDRVTIQSFDKRTLRIIHEKRPEVSTALLVEKDNKFTVKQLVQLLGFTPTIYSPEYTRLDKKEMKEIRDLGISVIPWTVNDSLEMVKLIELGVDGIITDYPNILINIKKFLLSDQ